MVTPEMLSLGAMFCFGLGAAAAISGFKIESLRNNSYQFFAAGLGILLQTAAIGLACSKNSQHFFSSYSEMCALLAWALAFSYLIALAVSLARSLGALILPLIVSLLALSHLLNKDGINPGVPAGIVLAVHILSAFLGYGLFLTACGASVLYLEQSRLLKRKAFGVLFKELPSLEKLERIEILCSWLGLATFTVAIGTGAVLASQYGTQFWFEPKIMAAQVTWLIFGALIFGRAFRWLTGRAAAKFVLAGALLVLFTFILSHPLGKPAVSANDAFPMLEIRSTKFETIRVVPNRSVGSVGSGRSVRLTSEFGFRISDLLPVTVSGGRS